MKPIKHQDLDKVSTFNYLWECTVLRFTIIIMKNQKFRVYTGWVKSGKFSNNFETDKTGENISVKNPFLENIVFIIGFGKIKFMKLGSQNG